MRSIYLPIRSFGDFIITAAVIKQNFLTKVPVILPRYFTEIFDAVNGSQYFDIVDTIDYENQPAFFEFYKVTNLDNVRRLLRDIKTIWLFVNKADNYLLDYSSRRLAFTRANFSWPLRNENIYTAKMKLLNKNGLIDIETPIAIKIVKPTKPLNILVVPDSRIIEKSINPLVLEAIKSAFIQTNIKIAKFSSHPELYHDTITYNSFSRLIEIIMQADLIISAESLPYHLANYLNKPHFVIYNQSRHFKSTFMTPYMISYNSYAVFKDGDIPKLISGIKLAISA